MNATTKEGSITGRAHNSIIERVLDRVQKLPANAVTIGSAAVTTVATLAAQFIGRTQQPTSSNTTIHNTTTIIVQTGGTTPGGSQSDREAPDKGAGASE